MIARLKALPAAYRWGVLLPLLLVAVYTSLIQTPRYTSRASLVVERAESVSAALPNLDLGLLNLGSSSVKSDAALVESFVRSRRLFEQLDAELGLVEHWRQSSVDWISRLASAASKEDMLEYYRGMVHIEIDSESLILTLTMQAFEPEFAQQLLQRIVSESEAFINDISQGLARSQVHFAESELERANQRVRQASEDLVRFQGRAEMLSPEAEAQASLQILGALQARKAGLETELSTLRTYLNEDAPDVVALRNRIKATADQIERERGRQTGAENQGLNRLLIDYKEAELGAQLAADLYKVGLQTLEATRLEASRKGKFVVLIDPPSLAGEPEHPDPVRMILLAALSLHLLYFLAQLVWAAIREHAD